jgi:hypothetical protein
MTLQSLHPSMSCSSPYPPLHPFIFGKHSQHHLGVHHRGKESCYCSTDPGYGIYASLRFRYIHCCPAFSYGGKKGKGRERVYIVFFNDNILYLFSYGVR